MEFELYFIDPSTITTYWHMTDWRQTERRIEPTDIMSFTMTKNIWGSELRSGAVASSTMNIVVDDANGIYAPYFNDPSYWLYVANPEGDSEDYITTFHIDNAEINEANYITASGFDVVDLLNRLTVSSADIRNVVKTSGATVIDLVNLMNFNSHYFMIDTETLPPTVLTSTIWQPTEDITYRQLLQWIAEYVGYTLQSSGIYGVVDGQVWGDILMWKEVALFHTDAFSWYGEPPYNADYYIFYDNEGDPNPTKPPSYSTRVSGLATTEITGVKVYSYSGETVYSFGDDTEFVLTVKDNPLFGDNSFVRAQDIWLTFGRGRFLRNRTTCIKEAMCVGGFYYTDGNYDTFIDPPTPAPLKVRYHADIFDFVNYAPHREDDELSNHYCYGYYLPSPISTYTYTCNGMEQISCDIETIAQNDTIVSHTQEELEIAELQSYTKIVEVGEENGWRYKKYSDGTFEAHSQVTLSEVAVSTAYGGGWYRSGAYAFGNRPSFDTSTELNINVSFFYNSGSFTGIPMEWGKATSTTIGTWVIIRYGSASSLSGRICATIKGTWS